MAMSRIYEEGSVAALRGFYAQKSRTAPPDEAERMRAHVAALELSLEIPPHAELFRFLAAAHSRAFVALARQLAKAPPVCCYGGATLSPQ